MGRNFLKGIIGDKLNAMLAAAAMNFQRAMNLWRTEAKLRWKLLLNSKLHISGHGEYFVFIFDKTDFLRDD